MTKSVDSTNRWLSVIVSVATILCIVVGIAGAHYSATTKIEYMQEQIDANNARLEKFESSVTRMMILQARMAERLGVDVPKDFYSNHRAGTPPAGDLFGASVPANGIVQSGS